VRTLRIDGSHFKDEHGRTLILRGVNLSGSSKVPFRPNGATHIREGLYDHRRVSFVGRPFPLDEADEHFCRLRAWGLTFLRLLVTWEAVEHAGPGVYDREYLEYLYEVIRKAGEHGMRLFIDPHQDVWSRMCGGDGAPGWTLEAVGMDVTRLSETGAAIIHAVYGDPFPRMIWPTNYGKLATATMFTLFFGGNDFAPRTTVDSEPVQQYLQRHYIAAMRQVAQRLKGLPQVVGYDTLNEPSPGYIGWADLNDCGGPLQLGESPTAFQSMLLGAGIPQEVGVYRMGWTGPRLHQRRLLNPQGARVWRDGYECVWKQNGVWGAGTDGQPQLLRPDHFTHVAGRRVDFARDYLKPFLLRYIQEIRSVDPEAIIFLGGVPGREHPPWEDGDPGDVVNAAHWYDGATLFTKAYRPWLSVDMHTGKVVLGTWRVRRSFVQQLAHIKQQAQDRMGGIPTLIGEVGIPFDLQDKRAYRSGDFSLQTRAMDASLRALDANLLLYTLWNYTADNDNQHGDQFNGEDLSIFSRDQQDKPEDIDSGGRALPAVIRPYARAIAGEPLRMAFDYRRGRFELEFRHDPAVQAPTEIYLPNFHYGEGCRITVPDGEYEVNLEQQELIYRHGTERDTHKIRIEPA
jgi:hypothetical protein